MDNRFCDGVNDSGVRREGIRFAMEEMREIRFLASARVSFATSRETTNL